MNPQIVVIYYMLVQDKSSFNTRELNPLHRKLSQSLCFKTPSNMLQLWMETLGSQPVCGPPHFTRMHLKFHPFRKLCSTCIVHPKEPGHICSKINLTSYVKQKSEESEYQPLESTDPIPLWQITWWVYTSLDLCTFASCLEQPVLLSCMP